MQARHLSLALIAGGLFAPAAQAAYDYSPQWWIYSLQQACQMWSDGIARCLPVAVVGPTPGGLQPLMPQATAPTLPALPTLPPGYDPSSNPYLAYTPMAKKAMPPTTPSPTTLATAPADPVPAPAAEVQPAVQTAATTPQPIVPTAPAETKVAESAVPAVAQPTIEVKLEDTLTHFEFNKAELTDAGRAALDAWLGHLPAGLRVRVTGHADRFGPERYNMALSRRRAESVMRYLSGKGMKAEDVMVFAKGESQPLVTCQGGPTPETKACLAPNRRVEIAAETGRG